MLISNSAETTRAIGRQLAAGLRAGDVVLLHGDLGAGKTTFAQGVADGLGVRDPVHSPTFTLVHEHPYGDGERTLRHLDLYRLRGPDDLRGFDYDEHVAPEDGVTLVEWPERAGALLPERYLVVAFEPAGGDRRRLRFAANAPAADAARWFAALRQET
ncbi:MAG: tRNA (adenosine(37)-N6)-threonylcarbamoyltransferase complex ATPase subunit type 1 TsaE [Thermomicrobiales bacterium]|nr:tRNA (adenosine(37)-N6)-threonylcarbamoyltransferase complex ATPase subunit type 1 TsaE [Thermomicrobiales bacterium]